MLYNETATTLYKRANTIVVNNELGEVPLVTFHEQYATVEGAVVDGRAGSCSMDMPTDPTETFPLVHPETGDSLGDADFGTLQVMLHSLYLHVAHLRDNDVPEELPVEEPPVDEEIE